MGSQIILFLLVGLVYASNNPGWKENSEYIYKVNGRSLANLDESHGHHTGILFKAYLRIQPRSNGKLYCSIREPKYTQVHSKLSNGWDSKIPESYLSWKPLALSGKPFQVEMENGVITDLIVSELVSNWEGNMIKGIMSQFQLKTNEYLQNNGHHRSSLDSAAFTTMEDTVSGNTATFYQIRPLQEHLLQNSEDKSLYLELNSNGDVIEVIKHKNYSNYVELPSYFHGFGDMVSSVASNKMGKFAIRDTTSRAVLIGNLNQYNVQSSTTVNKVFISPTFSDEQMGSVISSMNVVLESINSEPEKIPETPQPVRLGNLVYTYSKPYHLSNRVHEKLPLLKKLHPEIRLFNNFHVAGMLRSPDETEPSHYGKSYKSYKLEKPHLSEAPGSPFLEFTTGFKGKSIKEEIDIVKNVKKLTEQIARDLQDSEYFDHEKVLDRSSKLISLIRVMDAEEVQTVSRELYNNAERGPKYTAWNAFLDALSESGTGPAFLCIQSLIEAKKLQAEQASEFISAMANSVREPTPEYMKAFFELIQKLQVHSHFPLNNTALLTYTHLIRRVYVDVRYSNSQYPVNSFGAFWNEGEQLVKEEVIPYLTKQLNEAISRGETSKIHVYICALGNIAAPEILTAYEPYLEGRKQASQFQRLMMILSMEDLAQVHQNHAASVLFKVYQNPGETEEVRMAAVYLLMNCNPSTETLMIMASYTNRDPQERVNAAVKSSIEHAAELEGVEFYELRSSARAARHLLTKKSYGFEYGANYLRNYLIEALKVSFKESAAFWGSEDEYLPKGIRYTLSGVVGGQKRDFNMQAYASSLQELFHVGSQQFESYQWYQKQQTEHFEDQQRYPWSSQNINKLFDIKTTEREQLEGLLYGKFSSVYGMYSFDNHTIERIPQAVRELEEKLKRGMTINKVKMFNSQEMTLSFPTELGMPFIFTYDTPTIIKAQGNIAAVSTPQLSQSGKIRIPETVQVNSDFKIAIATKVQSRLTLTTPFDNNQYVAGFDKHLEINIPLRGKVDINVKNKSIRAEIEPINTHKRTDVFRFKTWPYTSKSDIKNFEPLSSQAQMIIMKREDSPKIETTFGKGTTGMAFHVELEHERKYLDLFSLSRLFSKNKIPLELWNDNSIQYMQIGVAYLPQKASANRAVFGFRYQTQYEAQGEAETFSQTKSADNEEKSRHQHKIMEIVSAGIKNVYVHYVDASVDFQGKNNVKYELTGAFGKSNVDPKSRIMIHLQRSSDVQNSKPYEVSFLSKSYIPNTSELDMYYALENEPISETDMELKFGQYRETLSKINIILKYSRSEKRKQYLKQLPTYHQCKQEMCDGNKQLSACLNMTMVANLMDNVSMKVRYEKLESETEDAFLTIFKVLRFNYLPSLNVSRRDSSVLEQNEIMMQARFHPDLKYFDVSVQTRDQETNVSNIWVCPFVRKTFVSHPVIHLGSRWAPYRFSYQPVCVVDQTKINTLSNLTYPATISKQWTVMLQHIPKEARHYDNQTVEQQLQFQIENYAVLVRQNSESSNKKDLKITLSSARTNFKVMGIELRPSQRQSPSDPKAQVTVDGQEIVISNETSHDARNSIHIYALPYGEVKVEVCKEFQIIYDGERVKLTVINYKFKDAIRGLCGQFNGRWDEDFLTPENCFARDPKKFIKSYEVEGNEGQKIRREFAQRTDYCREKRLPWYADVIDDHDANRTMSHDHHGQPCTNFQTKYVDQNGETCFTIHVLPTCSSHCKSSGYLTKNVPVHCLQRSKAVELWKSQIDQGSSPDFSDKEKHKSIPMTVPKTCY